MLAEKLRSQHEVYKDYIGDKIRAVAGTLAILLNDETSQLHEKLVAHAKIPGGISRHLCLNVVNVPEIYSDWATIIAAGFGARLGRYITLACASTGVVVTLEGRGFEALRFSWDII